MLPPLPKQSCLAPQISTHAEATTPIIIRRLASASPHEHDAPSTTTLLPCPALSPSLAMTTTLPSFSIIPGPAECRLASNHHATNLIPSLLPSLTTPQHIHRKERRKGEKRDACTRPPARYTTKSSKQPRPQATNVYIFFFIFLPKNINHSDAHQKAAPSPQALPFTPAPPTRKHRNVFLPAHHPRRSSAPRPLSRRVQHLRR